MSCIQTVHGEVRTATELDHAETPAQPPEVGVAELVDVVGVEELDDGAEDEEEGTAIDEPVKAFLAEMS